MSKLEKLRNAFNDRADGFAQIATERRFLAGAFVAGLLALPFSGTLAFFVFAAPTFYYGASLASRAASAGLNLALGQSPPAP
jgi:hypothetical protein